jgi:hypothetical protein
MHIENDEHRLLSAHGVDRLLTGAHHAHYVSGVRQHLFEEVSNDDVILDNEDRVSTLSVPD